MRRIGSIAALWTIAVVLASCGGGSATTSVTTSPGTTTSAGVKAHPPKHKRVATAAVTCSPELGAFVTAMEGLRRGLEVGLSYEQYAGEVESIQGLYERIPIGKLSLACLSGAGTPSERAFDRYVAAANTWNACAAKPECGSAQIESPLQKEWRVAAHFLGEAKRGLS